MILTTQITKTEDKNIFINFAFRDRDKYTSIQQINIFLIVFIQYKNWYYHLQMILKTHELVQKEKTNQGFRFQMQKANQNYNNIKREAHFSNLSSVNQNLVSKFQAEKPLPIDTYFIYGIYINQDKVSMNQVASYFVTVFPKPKKPYIFVYFNDYDSPNNFSNFKNILSLMPLQYFIFLQSIFLVRPSLKLKASRYFTFGTISKYINNKIVHVGNVTELSERLALRQHQILKFLPLEIRNYFSEEQIRETPVYLIPSSQKNYNGLNNNRPGNMTNSARTVPTNQLSQNTNKAKSEIYEKEESKPTQPVKFQIDQYPKSERGIPEFFQMLLIYFRQHHDELEQQGIFRKSVSIQDETEALQKMHRREYDFLQKIREPHLVANLIKRFLSKLKSPIIPYHIFQSLMETQPLYPSHVAQKMRELFQENITKYLTLITLLDFMIKKVIPRSYKNKMNAQNISICFSPCIMWAEQRSIKDIMYMNKGVAVVNLMITNFQQIFGTKKQISKIYRSSFYEQQKKSISKAFNIQNQNEKIENNNQRGRETANFGVLFLQKKENEYKAEQDHSDISDDQGASNKINIHVISPKQKSSKSQIQAAQLREVQEDLQRKSDRGGQKKQMKSIPNIIIEPPINTSARKKGIFSSNIETQSPRSGRVVAKQREDNISSNKSNQQINSIHSDH